jgi:16S rRNA (cytosine1402-N4)-methyltransferase
VKRMGPEVQAEPAKTMNSIAEKHQPVMLERCVQLMQPALSFGSVVVDCTLGLGGHSEALLLAHPHIRVIGLDRDPSALALATERLRPFAPRFTGVLANYDEYAAILAELELETVSAVLFDLGVSSMQLDEAERGFAYAQDAPLDMRMNPEVGESAAELIARASAEELARIFKEYGEERFAKQIAAAIVATNPRPSRSGELNALVTKVVPVIPGKASGHPAKRIYQALRIAVNDELAGLRSAIPQAIDSLAVGGRIVVMSYHSLEDEIVKSAFDSRARSTTPVDFPIELPGTGPTLKILTRGVERAGEVELSQNPRAASARLRAAEKLEQK